jgi:hypothetical protein
MCPTHTRLTWRLAHFHRHQHSAVSKRLLGKNSNTLDCRCHSKLPSGQAAGACQQQAGIQQAFVAAEATDETFKFVSSCAVHASVA